MCWLSWLQTKSVYRTILVQVHADKSQEQSGGEVHSSIQGGGMKEKNSKPNKICSIFNSIIAQLKKRMLSCFWTCVIVHDCVTVCCVYSIMCITWCKSSRSISSSHVPSFSCLSPCLNTVDHNENKSCDFTAMSWWILIFFAYICVQYFYLSNKINYSINMVLIWVITMITTYKTVKHSSSCCNKCSIKIASPPFEFDKRFIIPWLNASRKTLRKKEKEKLNSTTKLLQIASFKSTDLLCGFWKAAAL